MYVFSPLSYAVLASVLISAPAAAQNADIVRSSLQSGSERLALFSVSKFVERRPDPSALRLLEQLMTPQAFALDGSTPPPAILRTTLSAAPVVAYDDNINGGNRNTTFTLGETLTFTVEEDARAKEGLVFGASAGGSLRYGYGRGQYATLSSSISAVHSFDYDIEKINYGFNLCARNHVVGWTFLDACASTQTLDVDLGISTEDALRLSATQLFQAGGFDHEITATAGRVRLKTYEQDIFQTSLITSLGQAGSVLLAVEVGEDVDGVHAQRNKLSVGYNTTLFDRSFGFTASVNNASGSSFLGDVREDRAISLGVRSRITDTLSANIRLTDNASTVEFFDYSSVSLGFDFTGWSF